MATRRAININQLALSCAFVVIAGCNNSPVPIEFEPSERLGDADRDGIINQRDQCPNTATDSPVDAFGCDQATLKISRNEHVIIFPRGSADISTSQRQGIESKLDSVGIANISQIKLESYTSADEMANDQNRIEERRIAVLIDTLISFGVTAPIVPVPSGSLSLPHDSDNTNHRVIDQRVYMHIYQTADD